jgi:uridine phosphorylase/SAM-dependent methyltransferase
MKLRESGMPDEAYWETLFDVGLILDRLGIGDRLGNVLEMGCGYGTFTVAVARRIAGTLTTLDIDPAMIERTRERAAAAGVWNVVYVVRDVFADGFGGAAGGWDACLLFNILHCEQPVRLLAEAARVVRPGGAVLVIHWRWDAATPRGPSMEIRPRPEQIAEWAKETHVLGAEGPVMELPPWHYGLRLRRRESSDRKMRLPPLLRDKFHKRAPVFTPENLLREARRQKRLARGGVPEICALDPDGDLVRHLRKTGAAEHSLAWACYHTELYTFTLGCERLGVIGCAVGAPFAVLVAEELFASGCKLVVSVTSAGQILAVRPPPYFVLATRALRDEGTSYHYLPAADYAEILPEVLAFAQAALRGANVALETGAVWTTDAPFRETEEAVELAKRDQLLAVEMETAALYAFAAARRKPVLCLAQVTNCMARGEGDFEKGEAEGSTAVLALLGQIAAEWRKRGGRLPLS